MTLYILMGDSGVGKSTILEYMLKNKNFSSLKKDTTRLPRNAKEKSLSFELNFISETWFNNNIKNGLYEIIYERRDFMYGVKKKVINKIRNQVIIVRCPKCALLLKSRYDAKLVLVSCGSNLARAIRLSDAYREVETLEDEEKLSDIADYVIVNSRKLKHLHHDIDVMVELMN